MMMYFYFDGRIIVIYFNGKHLTENMFKALQSKTGSCAHSNPYNTSFKKLMFSLQRFDCILAPSTLSKNLVQVQSDGFLVDQTFHFGFQFIGQNSHPSSEGCPNRPEEYLSPIEVCLCHLRISFSNLHV